MPLTHGTSTYYLLSRYAQAQTAYLNQPHAPWVMTDADFDELKQELAARAEAHDPMEATIRTVLSTVGPTPKGATVAREFPMLSITTDTRYTDMTSLHYICQTVTQAAGGLTSVPDLFDDEGGTMRLGARVVAELKHDGLAVELVYTPTGVWQADAQVADFDLEMYVLESASLRGDGYVGEDVTAKVHQGVLNVPKWVYPPSGTAHNAVLVVRGEAVMLAADLLKYNADAAERGERLMANARNAASGILRRTAASHVPLEFIGYDVFTLRSDWAGKPQRPVSYQREAIEWCKDNRLAEPLKLLGALAGGPDVAYLVDATGVKGAADAEEWRNTLVKHRAHLPWDIDGVVYKADSLSLRDSMGATKDSPRGMLAHKLPPVEVQTTVLSIVNQVGRSGKITPVAKLKPVTVGGVEVSSATLHNWRELRNKGVYTGAEVVIRRAGDVIPELVATLGDEAAQPEKTPVRCPCCGDPLESNATGVELVCVNDVCSGRATAGLLHWVSKKHMDIDGAGPELVEQWVRLASLSHPRTTLGMIPFLSVWADNVTQGGAAPTVNEVKVAKNIQASRTQELYRLLSALGIDRAGTEVAKAVSSVLPREGALRALMGMISSARSDYGTSITGSCATALLMKLFGDAEGQRLGALVAYRNFASAMVNSPEMRTLFDFLSVEYIPTNSLGISADAAAPLAGHTLVFTGAAAEGHSREDMQAMALRLGAKVASSVTKKCTAAVIGVGAGKKADDAAKAKVEVWTPEHFMAMCQGFTAQTP